MKFVCLPKSREMEKRKHFNSLINKNISIKYMTENETNNFVNYISSLFSNMLLYIYCHSISAHGLIFCCKSTVRKLNNVFFSINYLITFPYSKICVSISLRYNNEGQLKKGYPDKYYKGFWFYHVSWWKPNVIKDHILKAMKLKQRHFIYFDPLFRLTLVFITLFCSKVDDLF